MQNLMWTGEGMGSGGMGGGGAGGMPSWVHIPKPSACSGPSSFNSTCHKKGNSSGSGASSSEPSWVASSIQKKSPCSGPSTANTHCNPNDPSTWPNAHQKAIKQSAKQDTIAQLAKVYQAELKVKQEDVKLK